MGNEVKMKRFNRWLNGFAPHHVKFDAMYDCLKSEITETGAICFPAKKKEEILAKKPSQVSEMEWLLFVAHHFQPMKGENEFLNIISCWTLSGMVREGVKVF